MMKIEDVTVSFLADALLENIIFDEESITEIDTGVLRTICAGLYALDKDKSDE